MRGKRKSSESRDLSSPIPHLLELLHKWGIHTLGDLAKLDKEDLRARLGSAAVVLWERANGQSTRLLKLVQPPESFAESFEFEHEVETNEPLLFMLRRFLEQLSVRLNALYLVTKELTLGLTFAHKQVYQRSFKIPQPTNEIDLLFRMLQTHLENFKSEHPVVAVSLEAQPIKPEQQQFGLFETALRDPHQLYETLARLTGLLGSDRVGTPVVEETYRPDAFHLEPFSWHLTNAEVGAIDPHRPAPVENSWRAALRRFRAAVPASILLEKNKPVHLRSGEITGAASARNGPYLASGNWWNDESWTRIEWDVELAHGALVRCHQHPNGWQIDGIYD